MASGSLTVVITPQNSYVVSADKTVVSQVQPASRFVDSSRVSISASYSTVSDTAISASYSTVSVTSSYADNLTVAGVITASAFVGDGSLITGVIASGVGIEVRDDGSVLANAESLDFTDGLDVTVASGTASISINRTGSFESASYASLAATGSHLSGNATNVGHIDLDTTYIPADHVPGRVYWDDANKTTTIDMVGTDVKLQLGQELHIRARNVHGSDINNGEAVTIVGAAGNKVNIVKSISVRGSIINDNISELIGIATENISNNQEGYITVYGTVRGLDTSLLTEGDLIYVSHLTSGSLVKTQPPAPYHVLEVGVVEASHPTLGSIFVRPKRAMHFSEIITLTGSNVPVGKSYIEHDSISGISRFVNTVTASFSGDGSGLTNVTAATSSYVNSLNQIVAVTGSINVTGSGIITEDMILRKEDQQILFRSVITKNVYSETRQIQPTIPTSSYSGCQVEYHITKASATRQGVILGTWLNGQINYTDVSNLGIGNSDDLNFNMILSNGQAILRVVSSGTDSQPWQIHTFLKTFSNVV